MSAYEIIMIVPTVIGLLLSAMKLNNQQFGIDKPPCRRNTRRFTFIDRQQVMDDPAKVATPCHLR